MDNFIYSLGLFTLSIFCMVVIISITLLLYHAYKVLNFIHRLRVENPFKPSVSLSTKVSVTWNLFKQYFFDAPDVVRFDNGKSVYFDKKSEEAWNRFD